ncbi:MAG: prolyl oligopeptidase family serine peptidase [Pirellulales bacterium]|nr:prolyl oligopeptidase family serine peptidase [Pirellulales bacterium]
MHARTENALATAAWIGLFAWSLCASSAEADAIHHVRKTYNDQPFDYTMKLAADRDAYRVYRLTYPSPVVTPVAANNTIPADYYLPKGIAPGDPKRPAVVCLHILNGNFELVQMICSSLASRGVPAVMFKLPYYGERSLPGGRRALLSKPELFLTALPQGVEDARRTVDLLASREEVDSQRIGVAGISLGGLLGATAAARDPRLNRAALILAGGDLAQIIDTASEARDLKRFLATLGPERRREFDRVIASMDPLNHAAALRERAQRGHVLMFNGTDDRVIPKVCAEKLAAALGISDRVEWLEGLGHYTAMAALPQILSTTVDFFAQDLPEGVALAPVPPRKSATPTAIVGRMLAGVSTLMSVAPDERHCHRVDLSVTATLKGGKPVDASVQLVRGHGDRFRLSVDIRRPLRVAAALGNSGVPWMASGGKTVFRGSLGPGETPPPAIDPKHLLKLQMVSGVVAGAAMAPSLLDSVVTLEEDRAATNVHAVRITSKKDPSDWARLVLHADGRRPDRVEFDVDGTRGTVKFLAWQFNSPVEEERFAPPADLPVREVRRADVERMFVAMFNFAMEKAK